MEGLRETRSRLRKEENGKNLAVEGDQILTGKEKKRGKWTVSVSRRRRLRFRDRKVDPRRRTCVLNLE